MSANSAKCKFILLRIDVNSAVSEGRILDSPRFSESARTIKKLLGQRAKLVIIAHQGRKGGRDFIGLRQHARLLSRHAGRRIEYVDELFGDRALERIDRLNNGEAILLKNVRAYDDEIHPKAKNNRFIEFSRLFELYVNDAFSDSHRKHSSIIIPPRYIKSVLSDNFLNEVRKLDEFALHKGFNNTTIILGGEKVEDYLPLLRFLENKTNRIIAGGIIGNLFLKIEGHALGYEDIWMKKHGYLKLLKSLSRIYWKHRQQIILPVDFALSGERRKEMSLSKAPFKKKIMDIGRESAELFKAELNSAKRIIMKGPLGFSEFKNYKYGTEEILRYLSYLHSKKGIPVLIGGGHLTATAYQDKSLRFTHISPAGGATIAYLTGGENKLPGLLTVKNSKFNKINKKRKKKN